MVLWHFWSYLFLPSPKYYWQRKTGRIHFDMETKKIKKTSISTLTVKAIVSSKQVENPCRLRHVCVCLFVFPNGMEFWKEWPKKLNNRSLIKFQCVSFSFAFILYMSVIHVRILWKREAFKLLKSFSSFLLSSVLVFWSIHVSEILIF